MSSLHATRVHPLTRPPCPTPDEALLNVALSARPAVTAVIEAAILGSLDGRGAQPDEVCHALAHVLAAYARQTYDPAASLGAAAAMAELLLGLPSNPANEP